MRGSRRIHMPKTKTAAAKPAGKPTNKSAFVRSLPEGMPARDVIEKAKAHGMKMSVAYVYSVRTAARAAARRRGNGGASGVGASVRSAPMPANGARVEELLRAVAAELGLSRAIALLLAEQAKVRAVLGR
jgi:hypothetical protein